MRHALVWDTLEVSQPPEIPDFVKAKLLPLKTTPDSSDASTTTSRTSQDDDDDATSD